MLLFVGITQMLMGLCNAILITKIFCYRYSTINNFAKNYLLKNIWYLFQQFLTIKCTKFYSDSFRFDISIV